MPLQLRRGTDNGRLSITPVTGELIYVTDTKQVFVGDGTTVGGIPIGGVGAGAGYTGSRGSFGYTGSTGAGGVSGYTGSAGFGYTGSAGGGGVQIYDEDISLGTFAALNFVGLAVRATNQNGSIAAITISAGTGTGIMGYTGSAGIAGFGYTGSAGANGFGYTGSASTATGTLGYTGSAGANGFGYTGSAGIAGANGFMGYTGSAGIAGFGYTGSRGSNGGVEFIFQNVGFNYSVDSFANPTYPTLTIVRGQTYYFNFTNVSSGHPIALRLTSGNTSAVSGTTGNNASAGVYGNGSVSTVVTYQVPFDAPATIYYQCVYHSGMIGTINIVDQATYTAATPSSWAGAAPTTITAALDRLAALVKTLNAGTGA